MNTVKDTTTVTIRKWTIRGYSFIIFFVCLFIYVFFSKFYLFIFLRIFFILFSGFIFVYLQAISDNIQLDSVHLFTSYLFLSNRRGEPHRETDETGREKEKRKEFFSCRRLGFHLAVDAGSSCLFLS